MSGTGTELTTIKIAPEASLGTPNTDSGAFTLLRHTGESLDAELGTARNPEFRGDRRPGEQFPTSLRPTGGINGVLSYLAWDAVLAAAWASAWSDPTDFNGSITVTASTRTFAATGAFTNLAVGDWFRVRSLAASSGANNGYFKIATRADANTVTVDAQHTGLVDETATGDIESGGRLVPGTTFQSFNIEKKLGPDASPTAFHQFYGMVPNTVALGGEGELVTIQTGFLGLTPGATTSTIAVGTVNAAPTYRPIRTMGGLRKLFVSGFTGAQIRIQSWGLSINNNAAQDMAHSDSLATSVFDVRLGTMLVDGTMVAYYRTKDLYDAFLEYRDMGLAWVQVAPDNSAYVIDCPLVNLGQNRIQAGGENQPVVANLAFAVNPSDAYCALHRFPVPA